MFPDSDLAIALALAQHSSDSSHDDDFQQMAPTMRKRQPVAHPPKLQRKHDKKLRVSCENMRRKSTKNHASAVASRNPLSDIQTNKLPEVSSVSEKRNEGRVDLDTKDLLSTHPEVSQINQTLKSPFASKLLIIDDDNLLPNNDKAMSTEKVTPGDGDPEEVISLPEGNNCSKGITQPETEDMEDIELEYTQNIEQQVIDNENNPIVNPECQLNALLQLCANSDADVERIDANNGDGVSDSVEDEDPIMSVMTQKNYDRNCEVEREIQRHNSDLQTAADLSFKVDIIDQRPHSFLECPICGICITEMSVGQRELHTNACLDSCEKTEVHFDGQLVANDMVHNVDQVKRPGKSEMGECVQQETSSGLVPVLQWLETLDLSRYANLFIREEVDWDTLVCLRDEDLCKLGITALGPRRKILHSLNQLEHASSLATASIEAKQQHNENGQQTSEDVLQGRKLITDFFIPPKNSNRRSSGPSVSRTSHVNKPRVSGNRSAQKSISGRSKDIPEWMCIPGTKFRVDAFQHLDRDCSHWFLTHFHTDHYQGLTRGFRYGHVYCSSITAQLVNARIGVPRECLKPLPLNQKVDIDGIQVTLIDANHCPGSVMILFEPQDGKAILHTGDFRFCEEMASHPVLENCRINTLILDTTYCNPQYDFPKQDVVIQFIIDAIQAEAFNPSTLFLIGTYTIGKERIFFEIAKVLQKKIYVNVTKLRILQCMNFSNEDTKWLTTNENEAHIHVVPLWSIASFKRMKYMSQQNYGRYNSIVSFSPTGWSFGRGKKHRSGRRWQQGTIIRYEVPYSEHCSFKELQEFVRFINPVNVIPSVNNDSAEAADALVSLLLNEEAE